jgi:hypothetical protein
MAARGEGGYRLLSTDWDEYNKQIGGAMEFASLTRAQIEWMQVKAYLLVYLRNYRFLDLVRFIWSYRAGAWEVLKKIVLRRKQLTESIQKPKDYDELLSKGQQSHPLQLISSREQWQQAQKAELMRARQLKSDS